MIFCNDKLNKLITLELKSDFSKSIKFSTFGRPTIYNKTKFGEYIFLYYYFNTSLGDLKVRARDPSGVEHCYRGWTYCQKTYPSVCEWEKEIEGRGFALERERETLWNINKYVHRCERTSFELKFFFLLLLLK